MTNRFQLGTYLDEIYSTFPEAEHRPMIGITANYADGDATIRSVYYRQIVKAGGTPVIIPPISDRHVLINTLDRIDGLVLTGGATTTRCGAGRSLFKHFIISTASAICPNCCSQD